jgi:geranylgeranylglycerol-phosphate geranylgeranyltransferase
MRSTSAVLALIRWENALLSALGVLLGAWWAGGSVRAPTTLAAVAIAIALTAVANAENDYQDQGIDRVAHPDRPLPSGALRPAHARAVVIVAAAVALILSALLHPVLAALTAGIIAAMLLYSRVLKVRGLPGNLAVAVLASLPFGYGAWAAGRALAAVPLIAVAVPLHLAREIAKDLEDAEADSGTRRTLPVVHGVTVARLVLIGALVLFVVALWPLIAARPRLGAFVVPAVMLTLLAARRAWRGRRGGPSLFKAAMACAMASLVLAHWHR